MKAVIFDISRCSLHDGDGVRTVVFFKGCALACGWCHNPEGISPEREILFHRNRCINCGRCAAACLSGACSRLFNPGVSVPSIHIDRKLCIRCGKCADRCPNNALVMCGKDMTPEEVCSEVLKDKHYYSQSGGGVTLSGGEPLKQPEFIKSLLGLLDENGVETAVETALHVPWIHVGSVAAGVSHFLVDIKHSDTTVHKALTGVGNGLILENLSRLSKVHGRITVRIPLIPGINDNRANILATAAIINGAGGGVTAVEPLPYNNLSVGKYESLGINNKYPNLQPQSERQIGEIKKTLRENLRSGIIV